MVRVGTKPEIALAQEKTNYANDVFLVIQAQGNYSTGKAQLNQAMGVQGSVDFEVQSIDQSPVEGENQRIDELLVQALKSRPAYAAIEQQVNAQALLVNSYKGSYWPALSFQAGVFTYATNPHNWAGDYYGELLLNWTIFNGLTNVGNVNEQKANLLSLQGQRDQLEQQIRLDLEQSGAISSCPPAVASIPPIRPWSMRRSSCASPRVATPPAWGSYIELGDAQVSSTNAQVQEIQAVFNLNNARATLLAKLGGG